MYYILTGFLGFLLGLVLAGLFGMAGRGQQAHDLIQAWHNGYDAGQRVSRGKEMLNMVRPKTYQPEADEWPD